jgi:hypothetical protein
MADLQVKVLENNLLIFDSETGISGFQVDCLSTGNSPVKIHIPVLHGNDSAGNFNWVIIEKGSSWSFFTGGNRITKVYARATAGSSLINYGTTYRFGK